MRVVSARGLVELEDPGRVPMLSHLHVHVHACTYAMSCVGMHECVCMCVHVCACMYVHAYACVCSACVCMCVHVCACVCMCVHVRLCMWACTHMHVHLSLRLKRVVAVGSAPLLLSLPEV